MARAPRVGRTRLLSSAGPPEDILASVGSSRGPRLVLGPSSGPVGGPSLEPRAASHVVQNFRLHLVLAPVRRLEVVLVVLVVLVLRVLCILVPRSAGQLFFPVVSFGWAGEESWAKRQAVCVPSLAPGRTHTSCRWSQPEALGSWGPVYKYGCLGSSSREAALGSRTAGAPGTPVEKALQGTLRPRALKTSSPEEPRAAHGSCGRPRSVQGSVSVLFSTGLSEGGCVLKEAENPYSHQLHRGWWVWDAPSPSLGGTPERGPSACSPPAPSHLQCSKGSLPLLTPRAGMSAHPGEGQAVPGDRSPGPAVPALPGETGATCPHVARGCRVTSGHKAAAPLAALALFQPHPSGPVSCLQPPGLSPGSEGTPPTTVRARGSHLGAISWGAGPLGTLARAPEGPRAPRLPCARALTRPLGADGVPDHEGHHVPQVVTGLGEAPAVPLCAETFSAVIAVNDLLQPGVGRRSSRVGSLPTGARKRFWQSWGRAQKNSTQSAIPREELGPEGRQESGPPPAGAPIPTLHTRGACAAAHLPGESLSVHQVPGWV